MAGLPWFPLDVDFHDSPKVCALSARLREPLADTYISRVYAYCYRYARDRFDPGDAPETIERAARWQGRRGVLFEALLAVGVLERDGERVVVHGIAERYAPHVARRTADAERQRRRRDSIARSYAPAVTRDVTRTSRVTSRGQDPDVTGNVHRESRRKSKTEISLANASDASGETLAPVASPKLVTEQTPPAPPPAGNSPEPIPVNAPRTHKNGHGKAQATAPDPRHPSYVKTLTAAFQEARGAKYGFTPRDARAVKEIIALSGGDESEAVRRFRVGLAHVGFPRCDSIVDLAARWNAYAGTAPTRGMAPVSDFSDVPADGFERILNIGAPAATAAKGADK